MRIYEIIGHDGISYGLLKVEAPKVGSKAEEEMWEETMDDYVEQTAKTTSNVDDENFIYAVSDALNDIGYDAERYYIKQIAI